MMKKKILYFYPGRTCRRLSCSIDCRRTLDMTIALQTSPLFNAVSSLESFSGESNGGRPRTLRKSDIFNCAVATPIESPNLKKKYNSIHNSKMNCNTYENAYFFGNFIMFHREIQSLFVVS